MMQELKMIHSEIQALRDEHADILLLEALGNNALYVLSRDRQARSVRMENRQEAFIEFVKTDLQSTLNREVIWAKEELQENNAAKLQEWFGKSKRQLLLDIGQFFD